MAAACSPRLDAEADHHRQRRVGLDASNGGGDIAGSGRLDARNAEHRDIVDEPRGILQQHRQALVVRCRRCQANEADTRLYCRQAQFFVFLRRQVDNDQAIDASGLGVGDETFDAVNVDGL